MVRLDPCRYDVTGNLLQEDDVGIYVYGDGNRAIRAGQREYGYDAAGQLISSSDAEYQYDAEGRMVESVRKDGTACPLPLRLHRDADGQGE